MIDDKKQAIGMGPVLSVIVPVYNASDYIEECAKSLFSQTLDDIEYIFVDDCSTDDSVSKLEAIALEYPGRDSMIRIIRLENNVGAPQARRQGLLKATGKYIIYCDADDFLEEYAYEHMLREIERYQADGIRCEYYRQKGSDFLPSKNLFKAKKGENCKDKLLDNIVRARGMQSLWIYMFKSSVYRNPITFPEHNQGEDISLLLQLVYYSTNIIYLDERLYYWRHTTDSISNGKTVEKSFRRFNDSNANTDLMISFIRSKRLSQKYKRHIVALKRYSRSILSEALKLGEGLSEWKNTYPEINRIIYVNPYVSIRHKVQFFVTMLRCDLPVAERIYQLCTGHRKQAGLSPDNSDI